MSRYLATYDITHYRQRSKAARFLERFGSRLQRSVFEVFLEPEDLSDFRRGIGALLGRSDQFDLIPVDVHPDRIRLRWQRPVNEGAQVICGHASCIIENSSL